MRVRLRGINSKRKRLADGSYKSYYWAWKGGPPLRGEPGTPEFIASYNEAVAKKVMTPTGKLLSLLQAYQASDDFLDRADRTKLDYVRQIKLIERQFADFPLSAMTDKRTRGIFKAWRERLADNVSPPSGLRLDRACPGALFWHGSRTCCRQSLRARRASLSRLACGEDLDACRRGRILGTRTRASALTTFARAMDWPTAR